MEVTDKQIEEYQKIHKKEHGEDISREDAIESINNLIGFFSVLLKIDRKDKERQHRLKKEPKGFHIEGVGYSCCICGFNISNEETWYDKNGIKCLICQKALDKKLIPALVCRNKDSWYSIHELDYYFNIKSATVRRLIRQGKLKARIVPSENKKPYFYIL